MAQLCWDWVASRYGEQPLDTHMTFAAIITLAIALYPLAQPKIADRLVAADGTGDFRTIQAAVDSIAPGNRERVVIHIKNGSYGEQVRIRNSFITFRGEDRKKTRIIAEVDTSACTIQPGESKEEHCATVIADGTDLIFENLSIVNSFDASGGGKGAALSIVNDATRAVVSNVDLVGSGGDTLVLSARRARAGDGGEYYLNDVSVSGTYHIMVARGATYVTNSRFWCMGGAKNCLFSEGVTRETDKLVIRKSTIDGPEPFGLGSYFRDAAWYFIDDTISAKLRVDGQIFREPAKDYAMKWGEGRIYFSNNHAPNYAWLRDNLEGSPAKSKEQVTAAWMFPAWNPESKKGPTIVSVDDQGEEIRVTFSGSVTVHGEPRVRLDSGKAASYTSGGGSETLIFRGARGGGKPVNLDLNGGAIFASAASRWRRDADTKLPGASAN
jgi:pectinesterase